jgi:hypothetical protein
MSKPGGIMVSSEDVKLLVRGYIEDEAPLRVAVNSSKFVFSGSCTAYKVELDAVSFDLTNCLFEFRDIPVGHPNLPLGRKAESCLVAARLEDDFEMLIMLLMR